MAAQPETELYFLIKKAQGGDSRSAWLFVEHSKIKAIIRGRLSDYRRMYHWISDEDLLDVEFGLIPRIIEILANFELSEQPNDGRVISYFALRLRGEADFLFKKITSMRQMVDEKTGKSYLMSLNQTLDGMEELLPENKNHTDDLINSIESERQNQLFKQVIDEIDMNSNDKLWLHCFLLRNRDMTWAEIAEKFNYKNADHIWLKENTARFVTRMKHKMLLAGEQVNYRICGVYTDFGEIAFAIYDSNDKKKTVVWSKTYEQYSDLEKIEAKLGDFFRQAEINYVVLNAVEIENPAYVSIMKSLTKREAFVETVNLKAFVDLLHRMPSNVNGITLNDSHRAALTLVYVKKAWIDDRRERGITLSKKVSSSDRSSFI